MNWIIFNNNNINQYIDFINSHKNSGIWHYPSWLNFQLASKRANDGFFFGIEMNGEIKAGGLFLIYKSGLKFNYGYIPAGLLYKEINEDIYKFFLDNFKKVSKSKKIIFTQIDSIVPFDEEYDRIINKMKNHVLNIHAPIPSFSTIVDLSQSEEEILNNMKPKGRYNIKLAVKKEVKIIKTGKNDFKTFYNLLKETSSRDGFNVNSREYYEKMVETLPECELLLAIYDNKIIAGGIFTYTKNQGLYYYGASSNEFRNLMAPYLLQWRAILNAKDRACSYYDFLGISNPDSEDKLSGVTDFKLKFGGNIVKFNSSYHIIHNKFIYLSYKIIKKLLNKE
jgi:peptidoglycan pentaglycine glycine transferase (the first glycine)